jgi:uncharacterized protein (TIGR02145 family)
MNHKRIMFPGFIALIFILLLTAGCLDTPSVHIKIPEVETSEVVAITDTSATSGGKILSDGGAPIMASGIVWSTSPNPTLADFFTTDNNAYGSFSSHMNSLSGNTTYYLRAYATNKAGTGYGKKISFTTADSTPSITVRDADGNIYKAVTIGTQVWMAENLKTTRYSDGSGIPLVTDNAEWKMLATPGYCWFWNNKTIYGDIFGALYNSHAMQTGKLCPQGWRVPFETDWQVLIHYLGGKEVAGNKLKEAGALYWTPGNTGTNETGFTARPGGFRSLDGIFGHMWLLAYLGVAPDDAKAIKWVPFRYLHTDNGGIYSQSGNIELGVSVRCIMEER